MQTTTTKTNAPTARNVRKPNIIVLPPDCEQTIRPLVSSAPAYLTPGKISISICEQELHPHRSNAQPFARGQTVGRIRRNRLFIDVGAVIVPEAFEIIVAVNAGDLSMRPRRCALGIERREVDVELLAGEARPSIWSPNERWLSLQFKDYSC